MTKSLNSKNCAYEARLVMLRVFVGQILGLLCYFKMNFSKV